MMTAQILSARRQQPSELPAPASLDAEQALLGAILVNGDAYAQAAVLVRSEHFSEEIHRRIFDVMGQLLQAGRPISPAGLISFLGDHEIGQGVSTRQYLATLATEASTVLLAPEHARIIRDTAVRRSLIGVGHALVQRATDAIVDRSPVQVAADSLDALRVVLEEAPQGQTRFTAGAGAADLIEHVEAIRRGEIVAQALQTGFGDLDRTLGGLHPGTIVIVAGRPGMGKTVIMTALAYGVARRNAEIGVLEFSLEIPRNEVLARHLAGVAFDLDRPIHFSAILSGDLNDAEVERIVDAQRELGRLAIVIECPPRITAPELIGRIQVEKRAMAARGIRLGVVLIDYLDKIPPSDRYAGQKTYEIEETVTALKAAARSENVCIVLLAQLNRATEQRSDPRPTMADIKNSSFLEQEAHAIVFVYREAYYVFQSEDYRDGKPEAELRFQQVEHDLELIIGKNRSGPVKTIKLWSDLASSYISLHA